MINLTISPRLKQICPNLTLGTVTAEVEVIGHVADLWKEIDTVCARIKSAYAIGEVAQIPRLKDARDVYRKLGKDPTRYRISSDSLIRRILKGQELYQVNNIVDINNLISLSSAYSLGSYDLDKIGDTVVFRIGAEGESYEGIGRGPLNLENLPLLADERGSFGSPTSDSERAMVTTETKRLLMNIISFSGEDGIAEYMELAIELLQKYANGRYMQTHIVR